MNNIVPPLRSTQPAADIQGFFKIVGEALNLHIKTEGPPDGNVPVYVEDFPKERLDKPDDPFYVITFAVDGCEMSSTSNDADRRPRLPVIRNEIQHPSLEGYNLVTFGWWEDAVVIFTIWGRTNGNANNLGIWFHKFMMKYAGMFKFFDARGVQQFRFVKRLQDATTQQEGQEIYSRSFAYSIRVEYLDTAIRRQITNISPSVNGQNLDQLS